jgi:hypothetical protein
MRINSSVAAPAVARTPETKATVEAKPAVGTKPAPGLVARDEFRPGPGGIIGRPVPLPPGGIIGRPVPLPPGGIIGRPVPLPFPLPPPFPGKPVDAKTRATQANQLDQISNGVRNGSVTAQEAERLLKEQQDIAAYQQKAMADGKLSKEEQLRLAVMQSKAALNVHQATTNGDRNLFAKLDPNAQRQANQISQIADGRRNGNITNTEAGHLLGDQVEIADARGDADSPKEHLALQGKLTAADRDIKYHSKPGTQFDLKPFPLPFPRPLPRPLPFPELPRPMPLPMPLPRPELPSKPDFHILPYKGVING